MLTIVSTVFTAFNTNYEMETRKIQVTSPRAGSSATFHLAFSCHLMPQLSRDRQQITFVTLSSILAVLGRRGSDEIPLIFFPSIRKLENRFSVIENLPGVNTLSKQVV